MEIELAGEFCAFGKVGFSEGDLDGARWVGYGDCYVIVGVVGKRGCECCRKWGEDEFGGQRISDRSEDLSGGWLRGRLSVCGEFGEPMVLTEVLVFLVPL